MRRFWLSVRYPLFGFLELGTTAFYIMSGQLGSVRLLFSLCLLLNTTYYYCIAHLSRGLESIHLYTRYRRL